MHKGLEDYSNGIYEQMKKVDENLLVDLHAAVKANEQVLEVQSHVESIFQLKDQMAIVQADALNNELKHKLREAVVRKLDSLVALEENATSAIRARAIAQVKANVVKSFTDDKAAKEAALAQAIAVIAGGEKATMGKDVVGNAFVSALGAYRESYKKIPAGSDEILVKLEKDIAAVCTPPELDSKGGNVKVELIRGKA